LMNTSFVARKPNIITTKLKANEANTYLSAPTAVVVMDPYESEFLMRFNTTVSLNGFSAKAHTRGDTSTSLNFVSKEFVMANGFYKESNTAPNLAIRVASE